MGGVVGGLLFAAMLYVIAIIAGPNLEGRGVLPFLQEVLDTELSAVVFAVHFLMSILFGVLFALIVSPASRRASLLWGLVYGVVVWLVAGFLALRLITGAPLMLDGPAIFNLGGHIVYGLGLGAVYAWFARLEVYEALTSDSPRWRAWGRRLEERRRD